MLRSSFLLLALGAVPLASVGCGGGCGPDLTTKETFLVEADRDGWATSNGASDALLPGGTGDIDGTSPGAAIAQFFSFDTTGIPAGVTIVRATVSIVQDNTTGSPYATLGDVTVDHLDYTAAPGSEPTLTIEYKP